MSISRYLLILFPAFLPLTASAQATYNLLAPIGSLSGGVTLSTYLQGIVTVIIGLAGVLAVVMIVICAIQMMGSPSVSQKSASKECITNAILGLLLAIGSWIILNTINADLLKSDFAPAALSTAVAPVISPTTEPNPTGSDCYFKYQENSTGNVRFSGYSTCTTCEQQRIQFQADTTRYTILSSCYQPSVGPPVASTPPPATTGVKCSQSGLNLCEPQVRQCTNSKCAQFSSMAAAHAGGAVSANMIKAVILQESSCGIQLTGDGGLSCGPMHIQPATANMYKSICGVTDTITCGWLSNEANWDKAVCMSAEYLRAVAASSCGSDPRNIIAGYNGGTGACAASVSCSGDTNCAGTTVQKWECLYDDAAHTVCNTGYTSTRNYATRALYCIANPGF